MSKKKEISSKMYSNHRCGKCNRFGHHHDKCTKDQLAAKLDKFILKNKGAGKQTSQLSKPSYDKADEYMDKRREARRTGGHVNYTKPY